MTCQNRTQSPNETLKRPSRRILRLRQRHFSAADGGECGGASTMSESKAPPRPLYKHNSWSPDTQREEVWSRRKRIHRLRRGRSMSVTDEDLEELRACFELGFGFDTDSPEIDPKLSDAFPALELYYSKTLSRSSSSSSTTTTSDCDSSSSIVSPSTIFDSGDDQEMVKTKLRQWAQMVACSVRQSSPN
ncbi:uncharacterized protein LOC132298706 [Cornus florida]|uniref:uncharacterized protein LOC132298706 n=1 Tax=Cornus florida TaxID=4283 RepID=UPI00289FBD08|nr:uncharacterized protein LOC132298706 [Cornus florida]